MLTPEGASASLAFHGKDLIGHAFSVRKFIEGAGFISWVTQLVVHKDWRRQKIATKLLNAIWAFSDDYAWGLVTANPHTVRTLERATRRICEPRTIRRYKDSLLAAAQKIPYTAGKVVVVTSKRSIIDTKFEIDHSEVKSRIKQVQPPAWKLGGLKPGEEWLAFTFQRQKSLPWTRNELEEMFTQSEQILTEAYGRMSLDTSHRWALHAEAEVNFILNEIGDSKHKSILDFGCGKGRHVFAIAPKCAKVVGVDFLPNFLIAARKEAADRSFANVSFIEGDCRAVDLHELFDIGLCLYDVVGSYADSNENERVLKNLAKHIKPNGYLVVSVMNMTLTRKRARNIGNVFSHPELLQALRPSNTMQSTGDIFDPEYYLIDSETGVVFRKEQFSEDGLLSSELVVRDRRYEENEIVSLCKEVGFTPILVRHVRAGRWSEPLISDDEKAKEILVIAKRDS